MMWVPSAARVTVPRCLLQDADACSHLADSIWQGKAPPFAGGAAAACSFWQTRVQETGDANVQRAALSWMAAQVHTLDATAASEDVPAQPAVLQSAWALSSEAELDSSRQPAASNDASMRDGNGAGAAADECGVLLDGMQQCSSCLPTGVHDPVVRSLYVQALLRCGHTQQAVEELRQSLKAGAGSCELWQMALRLCAACCAAGEPQFLGFGSVEGLVRAALGTAPSGQVSAAVLQATSLLRCQGQAMAPVVDHMLEKLATASMGSDGEIVAAVLVAVWCGPSHCFLSSCSSGYKHAHPDHRLLAAHVVLGL